MTGSVQERVEASPLGQWMLSALLVFTLFTVAVWNMPDSALKQDVIPVAQPYLNATGLSQSWAVFAPDPPRLTLGIFARIHYTDGSTAVWRPPRGDAVVGHYRTYRWWKWVESARLDSNRFLWEPTAAWVAETYDHGGRLPAQVDLVREWRDLLAPGSGRESNAVREYTYFTLKYDRSGPS